MSLPLEFHPGVQEEVDQAYKWYKQCRTGLGQDFLKKIDQCLTQIKKNPQRFGIAVEDIREGQVKRFPFGIYYRVLSDRIRILAVYHTSRDPSGWQSRI